MVKKPRLYGIKNVGIWLLPNDKKLNLYKYIPIQNCSNLKMLSGNSEGIGLVNPHLQPYKTML
jgi:hypothetical protein